MTQLTTGLPLFAPPPSPAGEPQPWVEHTLGERLYRIRLGEAHGKLTLDAEFFHDRYGWREVRLHGRKVQLATALGWGERDPHHRVFKLHDGRWIGGPV